MNFPEPETKSEIESQSPPVRIPDPLVFEPGESIDCELPLPVTDSSTPSVIPEKTQSLARNEFPLQCSSNDSVNSITNTLQGLKDKAPKETMHLPPKLPMDTSMSIEFKGEQIHELSQQKETPQLHREPGVLQQLQELITVQTYETVKQQEYSNGQLQSERHNHMQPLEVDDLPQPSQQTSHEQEDHQPQQARVSQGEQREDEQPQLPQQMTPQPQDLPQVSQPVFDHMDHSALRLRKMNDTTSRTTMHKVLTWGTQNHKHPEMSFEEYFLQEKQMTKDRYKGIFNSIQREKLARDPTGTTYDVTLLFATIKHGSENVAPPNSPMWISDGDNLERTLSSLKKFRNDLMHEEAHLTLSDFMQRTEALRDHLKRALELAGEKYSIDTILIEALVIDMNNYINIIREQPVANFDITTYDNTHLYKELQNILLTFGKEEIGYIYNKFSHFNPVFFVAGKDLNLKVDTVFIHTEVVEDWKRETDEEEDNETIEYENMLLFGGKSKRGSSKIRILEGRAGSGKSTLTKKMMGDWVEGDSIMVDLTSFDLLLYVECRDSTIKSFLNLLTSLMPKTARRFRDCDLEKCALGLKLLIIVDGLDELNKSSSELFKEILNLKQKHDIYLLCTTRPEKVEDCYLMIPEGEETTHMKLTGIADNRREEFASNYHEELRKLGESQQDTRGLIEYLRTNGRSLQEHWRLPLNLVFLTVLWSIAPQKVNCVTTATELYFEMYKLTMNKLLVRLKNTEQTQSVAVRDLQYKVELFVLKLCEEALHGLKNDEIILSNRSIAALEQICSKAGISKEESFGAFLIHKITWTVTGILYKINYPHKGIQDFLSALCILLKLKEKGVDLDIRDLFRSNIFELSPDMKLAYTAHGSTSNLEGSASTPFVNRVVASVSGAVNAFQRVCDNVRQWGSNMIRVTKQKRSFRTGRTPPLQRVRNAVSEPVLNLWHANVNSMFITDILKELHPENMKDIKYYKFNNTFVHLIGLLHLTSKKNIKRSLVVELVSILQRTGVKKKEDWLDLISNVKCNDIVAEVIAEKIPCITQEYTIIKDSRVYSYVSLFQKKCPEIVSVDISAKPMDIPRLDALLHLLCDHVCDVESLEFHDEFQYPSHVSSNIDLTVQQIFQECVVRNYRGALSSRFGSSLPHPIEKLRIGIGNPEQYSQLLNLLNTPKTSLSSLKRLVLHLSNGIDYTQLTPIPGGLNIHLYLSDVDSNTIEWTCNAAMAIQPDANRGFVSLSFPRCRLDLDDFEKLLKKLSKTGIRVSSAVCTSVPIPWERNQEFQTLTQRCFRADLLLMADHELWRKK